MVLVVVAAVAAAAFPGRVRREMRDFEVYWTAGARAGAAAPLYRADDGHYRFKYLPAFAMMVAPLSRLPLPAAKAVWFALSVGCLLLLVALSVSALGDSSIGRAVLAALTVVAMAKFYAHELLLGQANLLFAALCTIGLTGLLRGREALAAIGFGAATLVKPYALLFVPYLFAIGRIRAAVIASVVNLAVLAAPVAVYGWSATIRMLDDFRRTASETSVPLLTNPDSISVFALAAKWFGWGTFAAAFAALAGAVLCAAFAVVLLRRKTVARPERLEIALALTYIPLLTPQGWDYVLLLSTPLVTLLISRAPGMAPGERRTFIVALCIAAFSLYDVMGRAAYARFMALSIVTLCYFVIVAVAVRLRVRRVD